MGDMTDDAIWDALEADLAREFSQDAHREWATHLPRLVNGWWTPKEGEEMLISDMTDSHLENCISWIARNQRDIENRHQAELHRWTGHYKMLGMLDEIDKLRGWIDQVREFLEMSLMLMREEQVTRSNYTGWDRV